MSIQVWLKESDKGLFEQECDEQVSLQEYADTVNENSVLTATLEKTGLFSKLEKLFILGKIRFWEYKESKWRVPFVRIDNHCAYPHGMVMTPQNKIVIRYHHHGKTIDQLSNLHRVQLLAAPKSDFVQRVFTTYNCDAIVPKPHELERHFILYCDAMNLKYGRVV